MEDGMEPREIGGNIVSVSSQIWYVISKIIQFIFVLALIALIAFSMFKYGAFFLITWLFFG